MKNASIYLRLAGLAIAAVIVTALGSPESSRASGQDGEHGHPGIVSLDVLHGWRGPSGRHMAAIRFELAKDWKTYWRSPGQFGYPPQFDWANSMNLEAARIHWPTPRIFDSDGLRVVGYDNELILPVELSPARSGDDIHLDLVIEFGVCKDVCIPVTSRVTNLLSELRASHRKTIEDALGRTAVTPRRAGFRHLGCSIRKVGRGFVVTSHVGARNGFSGPAEAIFELSGGQAAWIEPGKTVISGSRIVANAGIVPYQMDGFILDRSRIVMTVLGDDRAVEFSGCAGLPRK